MITKGQVTQTQITPPPAAAPADSAAPAPQR
jgi:hypothetical protein